MPRAAPLQSNFNGGELSPLAQARVTLDQYKTSLDTCLNFLPMVQGPLTQRPGTPYVAPVKTESLATRLQRFEFSTTQAYVLEFGNLYMRVYRNHGQVLTGGGAVFEMVTPFATADLMALKFAQSADTLYVAHPSYAPVKITRTADNEWTLTTIAFRDGPYLPQFTLDPAGFGPATMTLGAITGATTLTAGSGFPANGINNYTGFQPSDVGRLFRGLSGVLWGYARITGYVSATVVNVTVLSTFNAVNQARWQLGLWSGFEGYPSAVTFFQDRLWWGGVRNAPQRIDSSQSGDYENMAATQLDTSVTATNAISISLNSNDVNVIRWMTSDDRGLLVGTTGGEWVVKATNSGDAVTPTNITATNSTTYGSANVAPVRVGRANLFVQRSGRKLREMAYVYTDDGFKAPDMTILAEHITRGGMTQLAYQQEPQGIIWATRADGVLLAFTYNREQQIMGWSRHTLGGTAVAVESIACIPAPDGTRDELWMIVKRTINGVTHRYVEYMNKIWDSGSDTLNASIYLDASVSYSGAPATVFGGLTHLIGESVYAIADGAAVGPLVVTAGGTITIPYAASAVCVGLQYNADGVTLRPEAGAADGTAIGKTKRLDRVNFRFVDTVGLSIGPSLTKLTPMKFRTTTVPAGQATPLFNGDKSETIEAGYDFNGQIAFRQAAPLPCTIAAIAPQLVEQDRA